MIRRADDIRNAVGGRPSGGALHACLALLLGGAIVMSACGSPDDEPARDEPAQPTTGVRAPPAAPGAPVPEPRPQRVEPIAGQAQRDVAWELADSRAGGRSLVLEVKLGGPPCDALTDVDVRETDAVVTVTVRAGRVPGARCGPGVEAVVGTFLVIAELAEPLGGRTLVDGARR